MQSRIYLYVTCKIRLKIKLHQNHENLFFMTHAVHDFVIVESVYCVHFFAQLFTAQEEVTLFREIE